MLPKDAPNETDRDRAPERDVAAPHRFLQPRVREVVRHGRPVAPRDARADRGD